MVIVRAAQKLLGLTKIVLAKIVTNNHNIKLVMKNYPKK